MADTKEKVKESLERIETLGRSHQSAPAREEIVKTARGLWDLFKELKKPERLVEQVKVQDDAKVSGLEDEINRLKSKLANATCRASTAEAAAAKPAKVLPTMKPIKDLVVLDFATELPAPNVKVQRQSQGPPRTHEARKGILVNPIYAGMGPYPRMVSDEMWIRAAAAAVQGDGIFQFLVNLLYLLHECFPYEEELVDLQVDTKGWTREQIVNYLRAALETFESYQE
jgi:hypothetical protein